MMVRARMWPLKHPICPDRMALKGQVLLLFVYSGGNRGGEGKCKFFEDGRGREIFIINCIFPINYVLSPRAEMWAWVSSCQLRRTSHISATASRGSALAVPKTQAGIDCVPKSQGANIDHAEKCWSSANNKHSPA